MIPPGEIIWELHAWNSPALCPVHLLPRLILMLPSPVINYDPEYNSFQPVPGSFLGTVKPE